MAVINDLRPGEVVSYGDVAAEAGFPGAARAVGALLAASEGLPWWRVVMASGRLAPGKEDMQGRLLSQEGVVVRGGRIVTDRRSAGARQRRPVAGGPETNQEPDRAGGRATP